jgi:DNA-binding beta-propeller fold protein YncE
MKIAHRGRRAPLSEGPLRASRTAAAALSTLAATALLSSCYTDSNGLDPPQEELYYPTNLVVSPGGKALYVTNSDFDLQYNGGTVQVLNLEGLREKARILQKELQTGSGAAAACKTSLDLATNPQSILHPGPCSPLALKGFVMETATIGAFASSAVLVHDPKTKLARLFVSVRGDPSVTYFDVGNDSDPNAVTAPAGCSEANPAFCLLCGQSGETKRCGTQHRVGEDATDSIRGLTLPVEPMGIAATEDGTALVTVHQTEQMASLIANYWQPPSSIDPASSDKRPAEPYLEYYLGNLPFGPNDVVTLPSPRFLSVWDLAASGVVPAYEKPIYEPGFLVTYRAANELSILRYHSDEGASPRRPFLTRGSGVRIDVSSVGDDSRGAAVDASERKACEAGCGEADLACLLNCATSVPLRFYVANRTPPALLIGEIKTILVEEGEAADGSTRVTAAFEDASITDVVPLTFGPSRVAVGNILDEAGERRVRVFAVTFDSRLIFVYDPAASRIETVIRTGRGPHSVAFDTGVDKGKMEGEEDEAYSFMYVGHFTDSYIGVVDLDMRKPQTFGSMFLTVGKPVPPRESK